MQRRVALAVLRFHVGAGLDELLDVERLGRRGGGHQRRRAGVIRQARIGARLEQLGHERPVLLQRGGEQRRAAERAFGVEIESAAEEELDQPAVLRHDGAIIRIRVERETERLDLRDRLLAGIDIGSREDLLNPAPRFRRLLSRGQAGHRRFHRALERELVRPDDGAGQRRDRERSRDDEPA